MTTTVEELRAAYDAVRADLAAKFECAPELVRNPEGGYILLEALTALAIAEAGASTALTVRPGQTLIVGLPVDTTLQDVENVAARVRERDPGFEVLFITGATHFAVAEGS